MVFIRSTNIEDLRDAAQEVCNGMKTSVRTLLAIHPDYNSDLNRKLAFNRVPKTRGDYIPWSLVRNDTQVVKTYETDRQCIKNIMVDQDTVDAYIDGQMPRAEVEDHARLNAQIHMAGLIEVVHQFIKNHPATAYNSMMAKQLDCVFADENGNNANFVTDYAVKYMLSQGHIETAGGGPNNSKLYRAVSAPIYSYQSIRGGNTGWKRSSEGEAKAAHYLDSLQPEIIYVSQKTFCECRYKKLLPFDFQVFKRETPDVFILIEIDGRQHREFVPYFHRDVDGFEEQQLRDYIKDEYCQNSEIPLVRIPDTADIPARISDAVKQYL